MNNITENFYELGEALFEEIVVKAALEQPRQPSASETQISLNLTVSTDVKSKAVVIRCARIGQPELELRLNIE